MVPEVVSRPGARAETAEPSVVLTTERLLIRRAQAAPEDVGFLHLLWTTPEVMRLVGFPKGLRISPEDIRRTILAQDESPFDKALLVELGETGEIIGQCKLGSPKAEGIAETDLKLLPHFWGRGFGTELKRALVCYLFTHTDCNAVQATPSKENVASQRMQEAVGAHRVSEGVHRFPEHMREYTTDVPFYVYRVYREEWLARSGGSATPQEAGLQGESPEGGQSE